MIKAIVTDIEGTTSSIRFVHDVLFPYAAKHLAAFVKDHENASEVSEQLDKVAEISGYDRRDIDGLTKQLLQWIADDQKITPLKVLQGMIWEHGYRHGDFNGHVYDDAQDCLKKWRAAGVDLYVYSSGSVHAQKLIFGYTEYGDLTPLFSGYFDTNIGGKRDASSYRAIVEAIGLSATEILFLSDIEQELQAAREAGLHTCWLLRDSELPDSSVYPAVKDFPSIDLESFA